MSTLKVLGLMALFLLVAASPVFAQGTGGSGVGTGELRFVGAALGMGIASGLCGLGQGKAVSGAAEAVARNPGARAGIQTLLVLGLAFIESLAIFTLLIIFVK
ncbi:MAG TPA: ATP synthase F0 subunit C [Bryobacteraceae bacterium]|jgi:F-type H+-transporting ATPase subunit c|nr:ATP synthase F0 subunit C [Bryobacteraceae bacterium]